MKNKIRIYCDLKLRAAQIITLDKNQSHYLVNVMRLKEGDHITVFNSVDGAWDCILVKAHKKAAMLEIERLLQAPESRKSLHLYFAPVKKKKYQPSHNGVPTFNLCATRGMALRTA